MHTNKNQERLIKRCLLGFVGAGVVLSPTGALANDISLTSGNCVVRIDPVSQAGVYDWTCGPTDHLEKEWFWLQVNGQRFSVDALGAPSILNQTANAVTTLYTDLINHYSIEISYTLTGASGGGAEPLLKEAVTIYNNNGAALDISLFLYTDVNLGGVPGGQTASLHGLNDSSIFGSNVGWFEASQTDGLSGHTAIFSGKPQLGELGVGTATLDKLNGSLLDLNADAGAVLSPTSGATGLQEYGPNGAGNATWAVQYDFLIQSGDSDGMGIDKRLQIVPEPTAGILGLSGLAVLFYSRRRKKA